ncbi:hypothetical protein [uncultured Methanoregula sp.]|uniref:hypothetical protein n=1 Tax=uncultured Methanoregula sp. TaxID=1005933 RepID=UPI002AAB7DDB|nr:hypothetical protein [uncultured Methanoregula sp.]
MTARPLIPDRWIISLCVTVVLCIVMLVMLLAAGCITDMAQYPGNSTPTNPAIIPTTHSLLRLYGAKIPQNESVYPDCIQMDSDIYIQGEVMEFHVENKGPGILDCRIPMSYALYRQVGIWEPLKKPIPSLSTDTSLQIGESRPVQRVNTADLIPGHYRINTDCGVSREFEVWAGSVTTVIPD